MTRIKIIYKKIFSLETYENLLVAVLRFLMERSPLTLINKKYAKYHPYQSFSVSLATIFLVFGTISYALFTLYSQPAQADWWDDLWSYRKQLTINSSQVTADLTNFPMLVSVTDTDLADKAQADGDDIVFTLQNGTILDHEIESFNSGTGALVAWVRIPALDSDDDSYIYIYYGNASVSNQQDPANVWDDDYVAVWHMSEEPDGTTDEIVDSTGNGYDGTSSGSMSSGDSVSGQIGNGLDFDGDDDLLSIGTIPAGDPMQLDDELLTVSAWFSLTTGSDVYPRIIDKSDAATATNGWALFLNTNQSIWYQSVALEFTSPASEFTVSTLTNISMVMNTTGDNAIYVDGSSITLSADQSLAIPDVETDLTIGSWNHTTGREFYGILDEIRVSKTPRSSTWIATEHNNQNAPGTFLTSSSEEVGPGPAGYWPFDEGYGTTAHDESAQGNDGTITGATWQNESMCVAGKCLYFDGSDSISVGDTSQNVKTVSFWVRANSTTSSFVDLDGSAYINSSSGTVAATGFTSPTIYVNTHETTTITDNEWYMITVTTNTAIDADALNIGKISSSYMDGFIDEVKIYPYARTADEIKQDYNAGLAGAKAAHGTAVSFGDESDKWLTDGLVGYWKMDETAGSYDDDDLFEDAIDSSGNDNTGDANGDADTASGKFGNGGTFDGTGDYIDINDSAVFDLSTEGQYSWAAWIYADGGDSWPTLFSFMNTASSNDMFHIYAPQTNSHSDLPGGSITQGISVWWCNNGTCAPASTGRLNVEAENVFTANGWYHVLVSYDGSLSQASRIRIYIDGVDVTGSSVSSGTIEDISPNSIRNGGNVVWGEYRDDPIDEVRIYNRALGAREVKKLYEWAPGPVAHWKMDEKVKGDAQTLYDTSGNGNDGTTVDGANNTGMDCTALGKYGSACEFDGTDDYATVSSSNDLKDLSEGYTFSAWIKPSSFGEGSYGRIIDKTSGTGGGNGGYSLYLYNATPANSIKLLNYSASSSDGVLANADSIELNTWQHVAGVFDGTEGKVYVNGVDETNSDAIQQMTTNDYSLLIGQRANNDREFDGLIDDVRIYNYARTSQQIIEDMNAGHPAGGSPVGSPVSYWKFDEGFGDTAYDSVGDNDGTLDASTGGSNTTETAMWDLNGKIGKAVEFDDTDDCIVVTDDPSLEGMEEMTISAWMKGSSTSGTIVSKYGPYKLGVTWDEKLTFTLDTGSSTELAADNATDFSDWRHVLGTYDGIKMKIYIDGEFIEEVSKAGTIGDNSYDTYIGCHYDSLYFDELMDEVKIYNYGMTDAQVAVEYNMGKAVMVGQDTSRSNDGTTVTGMAAEYCIPGDTSACDVPVGQWNFNEKTGTTAYDTSGNGNDGSLGGGTSSYEPSWARGKFGSALDFDGTDDYVDIGTGPTSVKTVSLWAYPETNTEYFTNITSNTEYIWANSGTVTATGFSTPTIYVDGRETSTIVADKWQYITVTTDTAENASNLDFGRTQDTNYYEGKIDHVYFYDYARTPAQIAWDYNRGKPIGEWRFDECQGSAIHDESESDNDGTLSLGASGVTITGTCGQSASSFWYNGKDGKKNGAGSFDGTDDWVDVGDTSLDINTVSFWIKADSTTEDIIDLDGGTHTIEVSSGTITATGFSSPTIYVDGKVSSTITTGWHHVLIKTSTAIDVNNFDIGRVSTSYFDGLLDDVRVFNYVLTAKQVETEYSGGAVSFR